MNRIREDWIFCCLGIIVVIGFVFWFMNPIIAILAVTIALLSVSIIYVYRISEYEASTVSPIQDIASTEEDQARTARISEEQETEFESISDNDRLPSEVDQSTSNLGLAALSEKDDSTSELRQRIAKLEKRVKSLNE